MRPIHGLAFLRWVFDLGLVALVLGVLLALVVARGLPAYGHPTLTLTGGSMEPAIPKGAVVVLEPVDSSALRVGDVVTVRLPTSGSHVTHRILDVTEVEGATWLRTKGDANPTPDPALLPAADLEGRVIAWIPALGYLMRLLSAPQGVLFVLAFSIALYASARLVEELEWELGRGHRARARAAASGFVPLPAIPSTTAEPGNGQGSPRSPGFEPRPAATWAPAASGDPDPVPPPTFLVAAGGTAAPTAPTAAVMNPDPAPWSRPIPLVEPSVARDPSAGLSPAARRAYEHRARRRRSSRAGGLA